MYELWVQAGGGTPGYSAERYHDLLREHGAILHPGDEGYEAAASQALPCGWSPGVRRALDSIDAGKPRRDRIAQAQAEGFCEKFEMPASMCSHCTGRGEEIPRDLDPAKHGPWFYAMYSGECAGCGGGIEQLDHIRADGQGGYLCSDCGK